MQSNIGHSPLEQRILWTALSNYRKAHRVTWVSLAYKLHGDTGITFYDIYFRRLRDGALRTETANVVYEWYKSRIDRDFEYPQNPFLDSATPPDYEMLRWKKLDNQSSEEFLSKLKPSDLAPVFDPKNSEVRYTYPSFLSRPLFAMRNYGIIPSAELFFQVIDGKVTLVDGMPTKNIEDLPRAEGISQGNIVSYLSLYYEINSDDHRIRFILSADQAIICLMPEQLNTYRKAFLPPACKIQENGALVFECDVSDGGSIKRRRYQVRDARVSFTDSGDEYLPLQSHDGVSPRNGSRVAVPGRKRKDEENSYRDLIMERLKIVKTGYGFSAILSEYDYEFKVVSGIHYGWALNTNTQSIFHFTPKIPTHVNLEVLFDTACHFRLAEQHLLGFTVSKNIGTLFEYASTMHAKTLDSLFWGFKLLQEYEEYPDYAEIVKETICMRGYTELYEAVKLGKPPEEISMIHART